MMMGMHMNTKGLQKNQALGTIITSADSPTHRKFAFVVTRNELDPLIEKDTYVEVDTEQGKVIAVIEELKKTNRYFQRAEAVATYESAGMKLSQIFPVDSWEFLIAIAQPLGVFSSEEDRFERVRFVLSPGLRVKRADKRTLQNLLGLEKETGLHVGSLIPSGIPVHINLSRTFQKHVAILAMTGTGKSYLCSVLIEELLRRKMEEGRVGMIIIDVHSEYSHLGQQSEGAFDDISDKVTVHKSPFFQIGVPLLGAYGLAAYAPEMSQIQRRDLARVIEQLRRETQAAGTPYGLKEIIEAVEKDSALHQRTKEAMLGWLFSLNTTGIFSYSENPKIPQIVQPGVASIIDLSETLSLRHKQVIVLYLLKRLFNLRKADKIPPFIVFLEEAHQFCPQARLAQSISRPIIETIAREGRKFNASLCLISQRPVRLSPTVISQCATHIILRITNPYDLDFIKQTSEGINRHTIDSITNLAVGEALIVGNATNFPIFTKIRARRTAPPHSSVPIEVVAKKFEKPTNPD